MSEFRGGGWGNYKSQRKPIPKAQPTAVAAEGAVWRGLWEVSLTTNFLVTLVAPGGTEEQGKLLASGARGGGQCKRNTANMQNPSPPKVCRKSKIFSATPE